MSNKVNFCCFFTKLSFISDLNIYSSLVTCHKVLLAKFSIFEYLIKRCKSQLWGFLLDIFNMELCSDTKNQYQTNCKNIESCFSLNLTIFMCFGSWFMMYHQIDIKYLSDYWIGTIFSEFLIKILKKKYSQFFKAINNIVTLFYDN